ncbi:MAG: hypothetical protein GTO45_15155 [Candidatus Aminicenantes bacterium]|nr:hypothetical protein [Candidatus Aminicenantes bacterium]NIM80107.1 hypothetical protein [Candidatus Aminicenantes bacterium]NIN19445.1 hypothetical protein [Candidatus Aminicenantes bacterium]NIN43345.1 hypothetical protein [Candidatus Aminicenantes bacterium]NIN86089.1 hypothetical protein [Candidatus Aminicenantes bacterium]
MELRLSEELLLVALNQKTGTIAPFKPMVFRYTLAAAVLQELFIRQKLEFKGELVKVINNEPPGDVILDKALKIVTDSQKEKKVQQWVSKLGGKSKEFKKILLEDLVNKSVLRSLDEHEPPGAFSRKIIRFRIWHDRPFVRLHKQLHDILVYGKEPDSKSLRLIGLINACKLTRNIFNDRREQEIAEERVNLLSNNDVFKKGVKSAVNTVRWSVASGIFSAAMGLLKEVC